MFRRLRLRPSASGIDHCRTSPGCDGTYKGGLVRRLLPVLFEHMLDLQGAFSVLGLANQIDDFKPEREFVVCVLEHGPDERREAIAGFLRAFVYLAQFFGP